MTLNGGENHEARAQAEGPQDKYICKKGLKIHLLASEDGKKDPGFSSV
jgi:hypothetical protein